MCDEVFLLLVPFGSKHFDAFWHFLSFEAIIYISSIVLLMHLNMLYFHTISCILLYFGQFVYKMSKKNRFQLYWSKTSRAYAIPHRPSSVWPSGRPSVNNFLFPYLLCNNISQRPNYGVNLLVPWSSCACAILVQPGPHGAPQGGLDQKFGFSWYVSQGPSYGLILLHTWSRYVCVSLVQSRCPGAPQGGKTPKFPHLVLSFPPQVYAPDT